MHRFRRLIEISILLTGVLLFRVGVSVAAGLTTDHVSVTEFEAVPTAVFDEVRADYRIFYGHTSHGSQLITGVGMLESGNTLYDSPSIIEYSDDLGSQGDTSWAPITRQQLDDPGNDFNMVMWSWCGGAADNDSTGIYAYLNKMNELEQDYPAVTFVYMTGHLDEWAPVTLANNNRLIREYCQANHKLLYDFADIESYDPDGTYYPDDDDGCDWCTDWCATHDCPTCSECAHSHCFNCYQKGKAFWWMMATVTGWSLAADVVGDGEAELPDGFILEQNYPNPFNPTTTIFFTLRRAAEVTLEVFNLSGQKVSTLVSGELRAGEHRVEWRADGFASGVYTYRLRSGTRTESRKMVLIR